MGKVTFEESKIGGEGKVAVFKFYGDEDPVIALDKAVSAYVGHRSYTQFVDINMDNPWTRVVILGVNDTGNVEFDPAGIWSIT